MQIYGFKHRKTILQSNKKKPTNTRWVVYLAPFHLFTAAGMNQLIWHQCTSQAFFLQRWTFSHLYDILPSADMKCEMELQRVEALQGKTAAAECCSGQADTHLLCPNPGKQRGRTITGLLCCTVKHKQRGAKWSRGWRRIREQTKQTTHRRSPKLTAKQVVNNPPVGASRRSKDANGIG